MIERFAGTIVCILHFVGYFIVVRVFQWQGAAILACGEVLGVVSWWVIWLLDSGRRKKFYGYHCGLCGKWINAPIRVPIRLARIYESQGSALGICASCEKQGDEHGV